MGRSVEEKSNENRVYWIYQCVLNLDVSQLVCASQVSIYVAEDLRKKILFSSSFMNFMNFNSSNPFISKDSFL